MYQKGPLKGTIRAPAWLVLGVSEASKACWVAGRFWVDGEFWFRLRNFRAQGLVNLGPYAAGVTIQVCRLRSGLTSRASCG